MLTKQEVYLAVKERLPDVTVEQTDAAYDAIDMVALTAEADARVVAQEWGGEAINGVDVEAHYPILQTPGAKAIKVLVDGRLSRFEYMDFVNGGAITAATLQPLMDEISANIRANLLDERILATVLREIV